MVCGALEQNTLRRWFLRICIGDERIAGVESDDVATSEAQRVCKSPKYKILTASMTRFEDVEWSGQL